MIAFSDKQGETENDREFTAKRSSHLHPGMHTCKQDAKCVTIVLCSAKCGGPLSTGSGVWTGFNDHETHPGVPLSGVTNSAYVLLYVAQPPSAA